MHQARKVLLSSLHIALSDFLLLAALEGLLWQILLNLCSTWSKQVKKQQIEPKQVDLDAILNK